MSLLWRAFLALCALAPLARALVAQQVTIKNASASLITQTAAEYLASNRFVLVRSDSSSAEFGLNLGKIPQHGMTRANRSPEHNLFWVIMEVHLRYKPKRDGLEVSVYEDAMVLDNDSSLVQRRRVTNHKELDNL